MTTRISRPAVVWLAVLGLALTMLSLPKTAQAAGPSDEVLRSAASTKGLRAPFDYPENFGKQMPQIVTQPWIAAKKLKVRAKVKAWRQRHRHTQSRWDNLNVTVRVAKSGYRIAHVAAKPKKIAFEKTYPNRKIRRSGTYTIGMKVPRRLKQRLEGLTRKQLLKRVQVIVRNRKDVTRAPGRDTKLLVQSNIEPKEATYGLGSVPDRVTSQKSNPTGDLYLHNTTPFNLNVSFAPLSCMADIPTAPTDGTNGPGESVRYLQTVMTPYEAETESGQSADAPSVGQDLLSSGASAAEQAVPAFVKAAATGNEAGMIAAGETGAKDFLGGFIKDIVAGSCANADNEQLWSASWAVTGLPHAKVYNKFGYRSAVWSTYATPGFAVIEEPANQISQSDTGAYESTLGGYVGAQASATFNWNNGSVNTGGTSGMASFAGGLTAISSSPGSDGGNMGNYLTFDDTVGNYFGPSFTGQPSSSLTVGTSQLECGVPTGNMNYPWSTTATNLDSLPSAWAAADFLQSDSSTPGSDGWGPVDDLQDYTVKETFSGGQPNSVNIPNYSSTNEYGCLLAAYADQTDLSVNGSSMNLGWVSFPHPWAVAGK